MHTSLVICAGLGAAALAVLAGVPACADALHLDPGGTGGGSSSTGSHLDAGPEAGVACRSNQDCSAYPKVTCDTVTNTCVECVSSEDCGASKPGTVCVKGGCLCPPNPNAAAMPLTYCPTESPSCVDTTTSPVNCGGCGFTCFGSCAAGKCADKWSPTSTTGAPAARSHHVSVWTGSQMFVWGGKNGGTFYNDGGLYDPVKQAWAAIDIVNAPSPRQDATAIWDDADKVVIVWGGTGPSGLLATGGRYDPAKNTWTPTNLATAPEPRTNHTAVWANPLTGFSIPAGMLVWGGTVKGGVPVNDGSVYDPAGDKWTPIPDMAPAARTQHTAVWDSATKLMIIFGGLGPGMPPPMPPPIVVLNDTFAYDPSQNGTGTTWSTLMPTGPSKRYQHSAVFDPVTMTTFVWGGYDNMAYLSDGSKLTVTPPMMSSWTPLGSPSPDARGNHSAVVVAVGGKSQMIIFGGDTGGANVLDSAWSLDTGAGNAWTPLPTALTGRTHHAAVGTGTPGSPGSTMIVWGGDTAGGATNTGAVWDASP